MESVPVVYINQVIDFVQLFENKRKADSPLNSDRCSFAQFAIAGCR